MVTRREQLGTDGEGPKKSNRGRGGGGRGRGRGRGKKSKDEIMTNSGDELADENENEASEDRAEEAEVPELKRTAKPKEKASKSEKKDDQPKTTARMKRPASAAKAKAKPAAKKQAKEKKEDTTKDTNKNKRGKDEVEEKEAKQVRTWGGRWIPQEESSSQRKMLAIKGVWEMCLQHKLVSQSSLQSPFYKLCNNAFRSANIDSEHTTVEQFKAVAELQVEHFLQLDAVRI